MADETKPKDPIEEIRERYVCMYDSNCPPFTMCDACDQRGPDRAAMQTLLAEIDRLRARDVVDREKDMAEASVKPRPCNICGGAGTASGHKLSCAIAKGNDRCMFVQQSTCQNSTENSTVLPAKKNRDPKCSA